MRNIAEEFDRGIFGDPEAVFCGWCDNGRQRVRGMMLCATCDVPTIDGVPVVATWQGAS